MVRALKDAEELGVVVANAQSRGVRKVAKKWRFRDESVRAAVRALMPESRVKDLYGLLKTAATDTAVEKKKLVPLFGLLSETTMEEE